MFSSTILVSLLSLTKALALPHLPRDSYGAFGDISSGAAQQAIAQQAFDNAWAALPDDGDGICSKKNVQIRTEFRNMAESDRKAYTDAVRCLQNKSSRQDPNACPGCKTLFDDFVAMHINQTLGVHFTGSFLTWHRQFVWAYHKTLATECGYTGQQPYWEWGLDVNSGVPLRESPIFNGDEFSMGSDGEYVDGHPGVDLLLPAPTGYERTALNLSAGSGGGCVFSGPFSDYTVNLAPMPDPSVNPTYAYQPRCLKRDLNLKTAQNWTSFDIYTPILTTATTPFEFQTLIDGDPRNNANQGTFGPHDGGHFTIAGDPGSDFRGSCGDPVFYLHHAQVDRLYWIWQNMDQSQKTVRVSTIPDLTDYLMDLVPSPQTQLTDILDIGSLGDPISISQALDTLTGSPYCYLYK